MRFLLFGFIALLAAIVALAVSSGGRVDADTPVAVLTPENVVLHLPVSPSVDRIVSDMHEELRAASAMAQDQRISGAIDRMEADEGLLIEVATTPAEMFDDGKAAATATALYDVQLDSEKVVLTVVTIELVPAYGSTASSREHEDGHALINEKMARRCAATALAEGVAAGLQGSRLVNFMIGRISDAGDPVHSAYHRNVGSASYGQHIRYAQQALTDVPGCGS